MLKLTLNNYILKHPDSKEIYSINTLHESIHLPAKIYYEKGKFFHYFLLFVNDEFIPDSVKIKNNVQIKDKEMISKEIIEHYRNCCDFSELDDELEFGSLCDEYSLDSCSECRIYKLGECLGPMYSNPSSMDISFSKELKEKYSL